MRNILYILFLVLFSFSAVYGQDEKVRVKVSTSHGAEIGINGDISSNNTMVKMMSMGEYTVTVYYGASYEKTFKLTVTNEPNQEYNFPINGVLTLRGMPDGSNVYVNGLNAGTLPCELDLLGEFTIRVSNDPDYYYDAEQRFEIQPFSNQTHTFNLGKVPPPTHHLLLVTWKPEGYGLFYGIGKKFGGYARFATSFGGYSPSSSGPSNAYLDSTTSLEYESAKSNYTLFSAGFMGSIKRQLFYYAGAGYGKYNSTLIANRSFSTNYYNQEIIRETNGLALDCGLAYCYKIISLSVGYSRIIDGSPLHMDSSYQEIYVGLGFRFLRKHNNK